jgi:hypothetical protein
VILHRGWLRRAAFIFSLPATLLSCATLAPNLSTLPLGAVALAAPPVYQLWQRSTEDCSGLTADFSTTKFYVVPGVSTFSTEDGPKVGLWSREGKTNRIVIAGNYVEHEMVVRHEMLHELLGHEGHPAEYFINRCHLTWESWRAAGGD